MIKLATVFSGIGAVEHALNRMDINNEIVFACDNGDIDVLSKKMNYSQSGITHLFKKELGVSIHKYILMRRLIHARNLIKNNSKISNVHTLCGYNDYSSFYKAYTKYFGYPPSAEKR